TLDDLAKALLVPSVDPTKPHDEVVPAEFFAIQVCPPDVQDSTRAFRDALTELAEKVKSQSPAGSGGKSSMYKPITDLKEIRETIVARYKALQNLAGELRERLSTFGFDPGNSDPGPELERILREKLGDEVLEKLRKGGRQVFEYGFVWTRNRD